MSWHETPDERARARAEQPVVVPAPAGRVIGVFTPPASTASPRPCVVMFTRPRSHRNRMFVELARRLAARGYAAFRFDYHGCGDSGGAPEFLDPGRPHRDDALAVLRALHDALGQRRFVLVGSCFDARTALSAFDGAADWIDGIVFMAAPLTELDALPAAHATRKDWKHVWKALHNAENWRTLGNPERWRHMGGVLGRVAGRSLGARGPALPLSPSFVRHFQCLARSRARALFIYGEQDAETATYRVAEQALFGRLDAATRARMTFEVWPGAVHSFLEVARQREVLDRVTTWIETLDGRAAASGAGRGSGEAAWTSA